MSSPGARGACNHVPALLARLRLRAATCQIRCVAHVAIAAAERLQPRARACDAVCVP